MPICRNCKQEEEVESFVKSKAFSSGYDTICLDCSRGKERLWRKQNPEKRKTQVKKEAGKSYTQNKHLKANYGITYLDYNVMFENQKGCCAICGKHQAECKRSLYVDHCHSTGKIRQLLCPNCNSLLGHAKDNSAVLEAAITYLKIHNG